MRYSKFVREALGELDKMISGEARYLEAVKEKNKAGGSSTTFNVKNDFPHVQKIPNARKDRLLGNTQNQSNILESGTGAKIDSNVNLDTGLALDDETRRAELIPLFAPKNDHEWR